MNSPRKYVPLCHQHITIRPAIRYQVNPVVAGQSHGRWALAEQIQDQSWYEHKTVVDGLLGWPFAATRVLHRLASADAEEHAGDQHAKRGLLRVATGRG